MQAQLDTPTRMQETESRKSSEAPNADEAEIKESQYTSAQEKKQESNSEIVDKDEANGQTEPENASQEQQPPEPPFSIFTSRERNFVVIMASLAALFSPLSANIYYPALNTLSEDLHESLSKINLTITTYLVWQSNTSLPTRTHCIADLSRASTSLYWQPFRRDRSTAILHNLLYHLHRGKHWSGIAPKLSYLARSTYDTELRE